ncbi:2-hydroxychromene-2-carboxylate isomerase [Neorhizobium sp. T6_25]|jgi:2-hydroxychromene-2-carboxylate isomerase|uniref:2-hydroxychromene-2-carboxylate isomerase n=1 Tax=Neorhizobium sp. T6_25 TaxID=2093833 RepID=UPI000CF8C681|nr:2-hydroxychromene-2-carboxylate isomerase [Neorhizobium sp. T6_25]
MTGGPVDFYFDPISPFSYLATTQIDRIAERHGRTVEWHPVLIGVTILKVMGLRPIPETPLKSTYFRLDAERQAAMFGVPFRQHSLKNINSVAACRAYLWLRERDQQMAQALISRISARLWVDGQDITGSDAVLAEAGALGADVTALRQALGEPEIKQSLVKAVDAAITRGVFGVPHFFVDDEPLWGCDRLWMLDFRLAYGRWPAGDEWLLRTDTANV